MTKKQQLEKEKGRDKEEKRKYFEKSLLDSIMESTPKENIFSSGITEESGLIREANLSVESILKGENKFLKKISKKFGKRF